MVTDSSASDLPSWIFDVDEKDEEPENSSLLHELEIDTTTICRCISYTITLPIETMCGRNRNSVHPLKLTGSIAYMHDFWGPCSVVWGYGTILWFGSGKDVSWVLVVWSFASIFMHLICRVWHAESSFSLHFAIMGYSVVSLIPICLFILLVRPARWLAILIELMGVCWASTSAILTYLVLLEVDQTKPSSLLSSSSLNSFSATTLPSSLGNNAANVNIGTRIQLLFIPVVLMELYLISLLPLDVI